MHFAAWTTPKSKPKEGHRPWKSPSAELVCPKKYFIWLGIIYFDWRTAVNLSKACILVWNTLLLHQCIFCHERALCQLWVVLTGKNFHFSNVTPLGGAASTAQRLGLNLSLYEKSTIQSAPSGGDARTIRFLLWKNFRLSNVTPLGGAASPALRLGSNPFLF